MATTNGTLILRDTNVGSKSEGKEALLLGDDFIVYKLGREGHYPINDDYFTPFDRKDVVVEGDIVEGNAEQYKYICVENISIKQNINNEYEKEDLQEM